MASYRVAMACRVGRAAASSSSQFAFRAGSGDPITVGSSTRRCRSSSPIAAAPAMPRMLWSPALPLKTVRACCVTVLVVMTHSPRATDARCVGRLYTGVRLHTHDRLVRKRRGRVASVPVCGDAFSKSHDADADDPITDRLTEPRSVLLPPRSQHVQ